MVPTEVKHWRESLGLTQQALANLLGVHQVVVARWESGRHEPPSFLREAMRYIGYQLIIARNQVIIDRHRVPFETLESLVRQIGRDNLPPHVPMSDVNGDVMHWRLLDNDTIYAIGEWVPPKWGTTPEYKGYLIPASANPKPEIRLPDWMESGYGNRELVQQLGRVAARVVVAT